MTACLTKWDRHKWMKSCCLIPPQLMLPNLPMQSFHTSKNTGTLVALAISLKESSEGRLWCALFGMVFCTLKRRKRTIAYVNGGTLYIQEFPSILSNAVWIEVCKNSWRAAPHFNCWAHGLETNNIRRITERYTWNWIEKNGVIL